MIAAELRKAINDQISYELSASNAYLGIACFMDAQDLRVLSAFFFKQSHEERTHALKLMRYMLDVGETVDVASIPAIKTSYKSPLDAAKAALKMEEKTTTQINELMTLAKKLNEHATASFLKWFVDEQVEEISTMKELVGLITRAGDTHILLVEDRLMKKGITPEDPSAPAG